MGFWYFLLLLIGIVFVIVGAMKKDVSRSVKMVIILFIFGILLIIVSLFMFLPGSAEFISELLQLNEGEMGLAHSLNLHMSSLRFQG